MRFLKFFFFNDSHAKYFRSSATAPEGVNGAFVREFSVAALIIFVLQKYIQSASTSQ